MPIYEYTCAGCAAPFEELVRVGQEDVHCPSCGSGEVTRLLSQFSAARPGSGDAPVAVGARSGGCCGGGCGCGH